MNALPAVKRYWARRPKTTLLEAIDCDKDCDCQVPCQLVVFATDFAAQSDEVRRLREALERLTELYALPGESNVDRFERVAEMFYRETGCYAPGKDVAAAAGDSTSMVERVARWEAWYVARAEKGRAALGSQP